MTNFTNSRHVFISYAHADGAYVNGLVSDLQDGGINVWKDEKDIRSGDSNWELAIEQAIAHSALVILIVSPYIEKAIYVHKEIRIAVAEANRLVLPIFIHGEDTKYSSYIPSEISKTQRIDIRFGTGKTNIDIVNAVKNLIDKTKSRNPYKAFKPFGFDDQDIFFGRDDVINALYVALCNQTKNARFLSVAGPSGAGKSSVIMAGLIPRLRAEAEKQNRECIIVGPILPDINPIANLAQALSEHLTTPKKIAIQKILEHSDDALVTYISQLIQDCDVDAEVIVYIDQFEELFSQSVTPEERSKFNKHLIKLVGSEQLGVTVLMSLRADSLEYALNDPDIRETIKSHLEIVVPMSPNMFRDVIEKPLAVPGVNLKFTHDLVNTIWIDAIDTVGALPLLEFTLHRLIRSHLIKGSSDNLITIDDYKAIGGDVGEGGLKGVLSHHVEKTYLSIAKLSEDHTKLTRALFLRLLELGATEQDTRRRRVSWDDLKFIEPHYTENMRDIAGRFIDEYLLTSNMVDGVVTLEISHEALIRAWKRLGTWINDKELRADIKLHYDISSRAREWNSRGKDPNVLYKGAQLQEAIQWQNRNIANALETRFIEMSLKWENLNQLLVSISAGLDVVLEAVAEILLDFIEIDNCKIYYRDNVENRLILAHHHTRLEKQVESANKDSNLEDYPIRRQMLEEGQVIVLYAADSNVDPVELQTMQDYGVIARIMLPMIVREQSIGLIELESVEPEYVFDHNKVHLAHTLVSQAAIAIANARLQSETASRLEGMFAINNLSTALAASIELEQIFNIVVAQLPPLLKAQNLLLAMLSEDKKTISYPVALRNNKNTKMADHALGDDEISLVIKHRIPQYLSGNELTDLLSHLDTTLQLPNARCLLGVPLIASDEVIGALIVADETNARAFSLDDQRVMTTIAAQIAIAIQNLRTRQATIELQHGFRQRTEERDRIDFLYRFTTRLNASLDMDTVLNRALETMVQSVGGDMGAIIGIDSISGNLIYRATYGLDMDLDRFTRFSQHEGLPGWVIQSQQSVIVPDVQSDPRWLRLSKADEETRSAIAALMESGENLVGVVMLYSRSPNQFNEDQLRLAQAAANQLATAMTNAELYDLIREQAERLAAMVRREQVDATKNAAIVESIADGVMVADQSGDIVQFNSAAERILGLPRRDVVGQHISAVAGLYASSGGRKWLDAIERWMADSSSYKPGNDVEVYLNRDDIRFVSVILSPVNMHDQFLGTVSVFRDITREIEIDRMKSEFVAMVNDVFRTPMASIKGNADLLLLGATGGISDEQRQILSIIKTNADRLSILMRDLLEVSHIDRGFMTLKTSPVDVNEVIDISLNHLNSRINKEQKWLNIERKMPENIPLIEADFDKFTQIINNILDNAFNYTYANGTITISAQEEGRSVVISVTDTGIGIAKEKQDRIWQRFFRDDEQDLVKATPGTGLGLTIVREYVNMHSGEIWLESTPGVGTTFYVRVPAYSGV